MLSERGAEVVVERPARRQPMAEEDVRRLLASVDEVVLARGKRVETRGAAEMIPDDLKGPAGTYRAPIVRVGRRLLVGFHAETLQRLLASGP